MVWSAPLCISEVQDDGDDDAYEDNDDCTSDEHDDHAEDDGHLVK